MTGKVTADQVLTLSSEDLDRAIGLVAGRSAGPPRITRTAGREAYPLSSQQEIYWSAERRGGTRFFHVSLSLHLDGELDRAALQQAVDGVVSRHEILRTTFAMRDGAPAQIVHDDIAIPIVAVDRRPPLAPFDLAAGPLLRIQLCACGRRRHDLFVSAHHILLDSIAMRLFLAEIAEEYARRVTGTGAPRPELEIQYGDYAAWQRRGLSEAWFDRQFAFWNDTLAPPLQAPLAGMIATGRVQTFETASIPFSIPPAWMPALPSGAASRPVTPVMALLAGLHLALYATTGECELIVAEAVANRVPAQVEPLLGLFSNMVLLRVRTAGEISAASHLERSRRACVDALDHQSAPFVELARRFAGRGVNLSECLRILFLFQGRSSESAALPGLTITDSTAPEAEGRSSFALTFEFVGGGEIVGSVWFRRDLLPRAEVERLLARIGISLRLLCEQPDAQIDDLAAALRTAAGEDRA